MGRLSWLIQMDPEYNYKCPYKREEAEADSTIEKMMWQPQQRERYLKFWGFETWRKGSWANEFEKFRRSLETEKGEETFCPLEPPEVSA